MTHMTKGVSLFVLSDEGPGRSSLGASLWRYPRREFRIVMALRPLASQSKG
jgi:hypothetical protein